MNLFQEADVMAQVGEECVLGEFRTLDFAACLKRPKPIERFWSCTRVLDTEACLAYESACFGEKVCGRFFECATAAAASGEVKIVTPHIASVQEPLRKNTRLVRNTRC